MSLSIAGECDQVTFNGLFQLKWFCLCDASWPHQDMWHGQSEHRAMRVIIAPRHWEASSIGTLSSYTLLTLAHLWSAVNDWAAVPFSKRAPFELIVKMQRACENKGTGNYSNQDKLSQNKNHWKKVKQVHKMSQRALKLKPLYKHHALQTLRV